jgi:cytochrome c peroxidase
MKKAALLLVAATIAAAGCDDKKPTADVKSASIAPKPNEPPRPAPPPWEAENPVKPLPTPPVGVQADFAALKFKVTPEKVRLGRWLFFDKRLSADNTVACATCHRPENAFSEPTAVSTGIRGQKGNRKSPSFVNGAWPIFPVFFWDGRAASLVEQAKGPIANPIEMGNTHEAAVAAIGKLAGYKPYFEQAFGDGNVTIDRIAEAIAAYEATRLSGGSAFDKGTLTAEQKLGHDLFHGKAQCNQCHLGFNFTDAQFHNLGIGWDAKKRAFADEGRAIVTKKPEDKGAFKTPTLRDVSKHAPYMHDGSLATLRDVVEHYNKGGIANPTLDKKVKKLGLTDKEVDALVAFMQALDGEGYADSAPTAFPQ